MVYLIPLINICILSSSGSVSSIIVASLEIFILFYTGSYFFIAFHRVISWNMYTWLTNILTSIWVLTIEYIIRCFIKIWDYTSISTIHSSIYRFIPKIFPNLISNNKHPLSTIVLFSLSAEQFGSGAYTFHFWCIVPHFFKKLSKIWLLRIILIIFFI